MCSHAGLVEKLPENKQHRRLGNHWITRRNCVHVCVPSIWFHARWSKYGADGGPC
uniref:Uncharacterized protein n=1 Tax=Arundo donax TaxID=35708 RepID=A0A0A9DUX4_ARUDO